MHDTQSQPISSARRFRRIPLILAAALLALLASCGQQREIEAKIRSQLKDPDDARFSQVQYSKDGWAACGFVNAKNSVGTYIGNNFFMIIAGGVRFAGRDDAADMEACCHAAVEHADGKATGNVVACQRLSPPLNFEAPK